jgi:H-NS histone family
LAYKEIAMATLRELRAELARRQKEIEDIEARQRPETIAQIVGLMQEFDIKIGEIAVALNPPRRPLQANEKPPVYESGSTANHPRRQA